MNTTSVAIPAPRVLAGLFACLALGSCDRPDEPTIEAVPEVPATTTGPSAGSATAPEQMASDWSIFRGDRSLRGVASGSLPEKPELLWTFEAEGAIVSSPVVSENHVYFGSDDGNVYCVNIATGAEIWRFSTDFLIEAPPLFHNGTIFVGSHDFFFYAIDAATGDLRWKFETNEKIIGSANIVSTDERDIVIVGSHDAFVYAFDADSGEELWRYETRDRVNGTPAVSGTHIVFGGCDTTVYVLEGTDGTLVSSLELGGDCHIAASVALDGDEVFFGHHSNEFVAIDLVKQESLWQYRNERFGFYSPPAVTDEVVVFGGRDRNLHCVDRATGKARWAFSTRRKIDAAPVICGDAVVCGSGDGRLHVVGLNDGQARWSYDIGQAIYCSPAVVSGTILVGANDGRMYAFGAAPALTESR